jgi:putative endopeptidase
MVRPMKNAKRAFVAAFLLAVGCSHGRVPPVQNAPAVEVVHPLSNMPSGIELPYVDTSVSPKDDFYRHANGKWLDTFQIPVDEADYDSFSRVADETRAQVRDIIEAAAAAQNAPGSGAEKIAALYASFMDEARLERLGMQPLAADFARIDNWKSKDEIPAIIAELNRIGVATPFQSSVRQDLQESTKYAVYFGQSELGLPDRDYYLANDDLKLRAVRDQYRTHIATMMKLAGDEHAAQSAKDIVALETELAKLQWDPTRNRPLVFSRVKVAKLAKLIPGFDWKKYLVAAELDGKMTEVLVPNRSYFTGFGKVLAATPLSTWQAYFKWQILSNAARLLSKAFVDEQFAFYGTVVRGTPQNVPRWRRGVRAVERALGQEVGKLYVAKYFPPENQAKIEKLVGGLLVAFRRRIDALDWMSGSTKAQAKTKLAKLTLKVGAPKKWRDYGALEIKVDDLCGNMRRAAIYEYEHEVGKLGKPIDRDEWEMTPQTVNAYYTPERNEIVFPAAILQPPFFDVNADEAVSYGGIGAIIGHEISHGFDSQGALFDSDGNVRRWFTLCDLAKFKRRSRQLVAQYGQYAPFAGYQVNGERTLSENIADNVGLAVAYDAYELSLAGKPSPMIEGLTGEQRLYFGWAQAFRGTWREAEAIHRLKIDTHSPSQFRVNGAFRNQRGFYDAFRIGPSDKMYLAPERRFGLW